MNALWARKPQKTGDVQPNPTQSQASSALPNMHRPQLQQQQHRPQPQQQQNYQPQQQNFYRSQLQQQQQQQQDHVYHRDQNSSKQQQRNFNQRQPSNEKSKPVGNWPPKDQDQQNDGGLSQIASRLNFATHKQASNNGPHQVKAQVNRVGPKENGVKKYMPKPCICNFCQKEASLTCTRCGDYYCSQVCQKSDWLNHKPYCISMP